MVMGKNRQMVGYCGIDCEHCDAYIATINNDEELREKTAKLWSELNSCEVPAAALHCMGCRMDGVKTFFCTDMCEIRKCAESKGYETCGECGELDNCKTVKPILDNHKDAKSNLQGE